MTELITVTTYKSSSSSISTLSFSPHHTITQIKPSLQASWQHSLGQRL